MTGATVPSPPAPLPAPPRPAPGPARPYHFPHFERRRLANGVGLVVAPAHKLPLVTVIALVDAGAAGDPEGREGLAQITARALAEGTATTGGAALTDRVERLGTSLDAYADWDTALVRMTVGSARLPEAMALLGEVLRTPAFPERELGRLKAERRAEILAQRAEPRGLADEMFDRFAYAPSARYSQPEGGSEAAVAAITRGDVVAFYRARYHPDRTTLVIAGDVTADEAERLASTLFGAWGAPPSEEVTPAAAAARHPSTANGAPAPRAKASREQASREQASREQASREQASREQASRAPAPSAPDAPARRSRAVHLVAKSDAPQSELRVGHVGLPRLHPDYFPVVVMNAVLGGLFSSRINLNLREAHGYTYGAHSGYDWRRAAGPFAVSTAVRSDVTEAAAREILHEIDRIRAAPITTEELTLATSYLDGVFPIRYETTAAIAAALANLVLYGLPDDFYDGYRAHIRGVTSDDVLAAARAHLRPEELQLVAVGDATAIRGSLESLDFGPVHVYDAEGKDQG